MSDKLKAVTDATFDQEVLKSAKPVLVDFWAPWCSPCRALTPILEELESHYADRISFVKINIDENPKTPAQYSVMSIPTLIIFKNGLIEATRMGLPQKSELSAFIESNC